MTIDEVTAAVPAAHTTGAEEIASLQKAHYDRLVELYEAHATDPSTQRYRRRFIDEPLLRGIELDGRAVLEAMCGSGHSTAFLLERRASVTGLDVSEQAIGLFRAKWPQCEAVVESILTQALPAGVFDVVLVVGGLHHVHPHLDEAAVQIERLLKPGGFFCFSEPHTGSLMNVARRLWYPRDPMFETNEAAIDVASLRRAVSEKFDVVSERYYGNVAHTLVLNSMVVRAPPRIKVSTRNPLWRSKAFSTQSWAAVFHARSRASGRNGCSGQVPADERKHKPGARACSAFPARWVIVSGASGCPPRSR